MGDYVQYSMNIRLSSEIPSDYIQALLFFADKDSSFDSIQEVKKVFKKWNQHIDNWYWFVNCNSYLVDRDDNYKPKQFSLTNQTEYYHFIMLSQCKETDAYKSLLQWLKTYILKGKEPAIGYRMGLSPYYEKRVIIYNEHKFKEIICTVYTSHGERVYNVSWQELISLDEALKIYHENLNILRGHIGFGFDSEEIELKVYENHYLIHRMID